MCRISLAYASLLCLGCGHPVQTTNEVTRSSLQAESHQLMRRNKRTSFDPLGALKTILLASQQAAAFNPASAGAHLPVGRPALTASHIPMMSTDLKASDQELRESLDKRIEQLGIAHPDTLVSKYQMAMALKDSGALKPAEEMLREVIEFYTNVLGFDAPDLLEAKDKLAEVLKALGDENAAEKIEDEVYKLRSRRCIDGRRGEEYWTKIARYSRQAAVVKRTLAQSFVIFCMPVSGLSVAQLSDLRSKMPEGTKVNVVKNRLMKRALMDYPQFQAVEPLLQNPRMWIFCTEDSFRPTLEVVKAWQIDNKKQESHPILGGGNEGAIYDAAGIEALSKLPSRQELMQNIAVALHSVPTKVARGVKAVPTKIARGVKLASGIEEIARGIKLAAEKGTEKGASTLGDV